MLSTIDFAESGDFSARAIYAFTAASKCPALLADSSSRTEHQSFSHALLVVRNVFSYPVAALSQPFARYASSAALNAGSSARLILLTCAIGLFTSVPVC